MSTTQEYSFIIFPTTTPEAEHVICIYHPNRHERQIYRILVMNKKHFDGKRSRSLCEINTDRIKILIN